MDQSSGQRRRRLAFDLGPIAQVVVDADGFVRRSNERARELLDVGPDAPGRRFADLAWSRRPVDLVRMVERARGTGQGEVVRGVPAKTPGGEDVTLDVQIIALVNGRDFLGAVVTFTDVTELRRLRADLERSEREVEFAIDELRSTRTHLERIADDLQTSDKELERTSEELRSSTEDLELTNAELLSGNQELERTSDELELRAADLRSMRRLMDSVFDTLGAAFVLDEDLKVRLWSRECEELWGIDHAEVRGRGLGEIQTGLPVRPLEALVRTVLDHREPAEAVVDARDRDGISFPYRVAASLLGPSGAGEGVIVLVRREPVAG